METERTCSGRCACYTMNAEEFDQRPQENTPLIGSSSGSSFLQHPVFDNIFDKIWLTCLAVILITGLSIGVYLLTIEGDENKYDPFTLITRKYWDNKPPSGNSSNLSLPIQKVLLVSTHTPECVNKTHCLSQLKEIKKRYIDNLHKEDILYNFVVAGDGRIYEGRGWGQRCISNKEYLIIALLGNFTDAPPKGVQRRALISFLNFAVTINKLVPCYQLLVDHQPQRYLLDLVAEIESNRKSQNLC